MTAPAGGLGFTEYFRRGEKDRVRQALGDMERLGVRRLRTALSWAEWHAPGGADWYDWLLPELAARVDLLPMIHYTPPSLGRTPKSSSPPRRPLDYADFVDTAITRYGHCFEAVELWNEPNNINDWDYLQDPDWNLFCEMLGAAAHWARRRGKRTVLPGTCPTDCSWLDLMCRRGVLAHIDVVGVHAFPGTWDFDGRTWDELLAGVGRVLADHGLSREIWITETGYSTWRHDAWEQGRRFLDAARLLPAKASRLYWYSLHDLSPDLPSQEGFHEDERHYHTGLRRHDGAPKLLYRLLETGGLDAVAPTCAAPELRPGRACGGRTLILGGAGRLGAALAARLLDAGEPVTVLDSLEARGSDARARELAARPGDNGDLRVVLADVRDPHALARAVADANLVYDLVGVGNLPGPADPGRDCDVLVRGRLHLIDALRRLDRPARLVAAGTVGIYRPLGPGELEEDRLRLVPRDPGLRTHGIAEGHPLYAVGYCLAGAAEGVVLAAAADGLDASVLRLGAVYAPGGLLAAAWDALAACPDHRAVRDFWPLADCLDALATAGTASGLAGRAANVGGGPCNAASLAELRRRTPGGGRVPLPARPAREPSPAYLVCDHRLFSRLTGWQPRILVAEASEASQPEIPSPLV